MESDLTLPAALLLSVAVAGLAYRRRSLSKSGVIAAIPLGTIILTIGGWQWGVPLFVFFVSSSILSKVSHRHKRQTAEVFAKGGNRDWAQVLANGGPGLMLAIAAACQPHPTRWFVAYLGAIAAVTADTWATEIGTLANTTPRSIVNWQAVPPGTSGGVSVSGTVGGAAGAALIGVLGYVYRYDLDLVIAATIAGTAAMLFDSLLGATLQARFRCDGCDREVETSSHCDLPAQHTAGCRGLNNDLVNLAAAIVGGILATLVYALLSSV